MNGNPGVGTDPGFTKYGDKEYPYPGSVGWWVDGLSITLYSDTLSLDELLKIAKTIPYTNSVLKPTETTTSDSLTPTPTELLIDTLTPAQAPTDELTQTPLPPETITPSP